MKAATVKRLARLESRWRDENEGRTFKCGLSAPMTRERKRSESLKSRFLSTALVV